ncbi:MAG: XdhC family protein [Chthoniobacterales bacterium]
MNDIPEIVRAFVRRPNETFALATLLRATGSSYRRPGARMLIARDGERAGSLSAGCLEDEVVDAAQEVIATSEPRLMTFDTRRRFGCNGSIEIFVERARNDLLGEIARQVCARQPFLIETSETFGTRMLEDATSGGFVQQIEPVIKLLIVGTGPDGAALVDQAKLLAWETILIESIAECAGEFDAWTAAIVATHNYGRDCAALRHLLPLGLRYLGVIGPRRRRDEMLSDALDAGATMNSQLFAPSGLHLSAETPAEIALSIVAEIQATFASGTAVSLSKRNAPIHESHSETIPAT